MGTEPLEQLLDMLARFAKRVPHNMALGLTPVETAKGRVVLALPYSEKLVGNPDTGVLHGGAITALADATSGAAAFLALDQPEPIATLDLRIDYLRAATPGKEVHADAHCYHLARQVAFTRCTVFHPDEVDRPVASCVGTFMRGTPSPEDGWTNTFGTHE